MAHYKHLDAMAMTASAATFIIAEDASVLEATDVEGKVRYARTSMLSTVPKATISRFGNAAVNANPDTIFQKVCEMHTPRPTPCSHSYPDS